MTCSNLRWLLHSLPVLPRAAGSPVTVGVAHMVREQVMATHAKSKATANLLRFRFMNVFLFGSRVSVFTSAQRSLLAAAQMCFCWVKRKSRIRTRQIFYRVENHQGEILSAFSEGRPQSRLCAGTYRLLSGSGFRLTGTSKRRRADRSPPLK